MLSFSTSWNPPDCTDADSLVRQIRSLGFDSIELGAHLKISLLPGIKRAHAHEGNPLGISNVEAFCPQPLEMEKASLSDCTLSSSGAGRKRAVDWTLHTIDLAKELGVPFTLIDLGPLEMPDFTTKMGKMIHAGGLNSRDYVKTKLELVQHRERVADKALSRARRSLEEILEYATAQGMKIGLKSAKRFESLPSEREVQTLLQEYPDAQVFGYWHNTAHSQLKENLGIVDQEQFLEAVSSRILGCHIQDVLWPVETGLVPFTGSMDFAQVLSWLPEDIPLVWKVKSSVKKADISQALVTWTERYCEIETVAQPG